MNRVKRSILNTGEAIRYWSSELFSMKNNSYEIYGFAKFLMLIYIVSLLAIFFVDDNVTLGDYLINLNTETLGVLISSIIFFVILEARKKRERTLLDMEIKSEFYPILSEYSIITSFILEQLLKNNNYSKKYYLTHIKNKNLNDILELFKDEIPRIFNLEKINLLLAKISNVDDKTRLLIKLLNEDYYSDEIALIHNLLRNNKEFQNNKRAIQSKNKNGEILFQFVPIDLYGPVDEIEFKIMMLDLLCSSLSTINTIRTLIENDNAFYPNIFDDEYYRMLYDDDI